MTRWYRAYEGTVTDPKLAEAALVAGCSRSVAIAAWHTILESAASTQDGGSFDTTARRVAVTLGEAVPLIEALFCAFEEIGMIEGRLVSAWIRRQFESDNSTERSRKLRERRRNVDATLRGRDTTPPDTEADTEKNPSSLRSDGAAAAAVEPPTPPKPLSPKDRLWLEGISILETMGIAKQGRSLVGRWLKQTGEQHFTVLDAIQRARDHGVIDPIPWITASLSQVKTNDRNRNSDISGAFDRLQSRLDGRENPEPLRAEHPDGSFAGGTLPLLADRLP